MTYISATRAFRLTAPLFFIALAAACGDDSGVSPTGTDAMSAGETPDCDALLTPSDFLAICGSEITLEPTGAEGIALNPCNRSGSGGQARLLVSRSSSAAVAAMGAEVAGGRGPTLQDGLGLYASAGSSGVFVVEVKATSDAGALCSPENLPALLDIALSRLPTG